MKQTVVITIESGVEGDNASVTIAFDPPIKNDDHRPSAAEILAMDMLETLNQRANVGGSQPVSTVQESGNRKGSKE